MKKVYLPVYNGEILSISFERSRAIGDLLDEAGVETLEELETICLKFDFKEPILNTALLKSQSDISRRISNLFLPHYCDGFYIGDIGIEISVDLNNDDLAVIEDSDIGVISKKDLLDKLQASKLA